MRDRTRAQTGVAKPDDPFTCWAEVSINLGPHWPRIVGCGNKARKGFLTCIKHANREDAAQLLLGTVAISPLPPMDFS
jgi:hypothetical protein